MWDHENHPEKGGFFVCNNLLKINVKYWFFSLLIDSVLATYYFITHPLIQLDTFLFYQYSILGNTLNDWINSDGAINEVGCIHTTQGYDLNYSGVIFGNEISFNPETNEIIVKEENYFDKNGKQSIKDPKELKAFILNIYKTIMLRGIKGTYLYVCDPLLKAYFESFVPKYETDQVGIKTLFKTENIKPFENSIPLYSLKVAAGAFGEIQQVEDVQWLNIPEKIKPSKDLFACQVIGESMNKVIPNGALCLFRKYSGVPRNGQIVLVENTNMHDSDFGSCYTVKEYKSKKYEDEDGWKHQSIF